MLHAAAAIAHPTSSSTLAALPAFRATTRSASIPAFPDQPQPQSDPFRFPNLRPPPISPSKDWRTFVRGKWFKDKDSSLHENEPLPLPMTYPGSTPSSDDVAKMKNCNPEVKDCKDVLYQWTGKCSRCQGTGEVSFYRKRGKEVISKCITCLGLGYVHKMTTREEIAADELGDIP